MNYNAAFFGLFENTFLLLKQEFGEEKALELFARLMETGLSKSYGSAFEKGNPYEFQRLVQERDNMVGLRVEFPIVKEDEIIYQFHDDPFPNLRGKVDHAMLDQCYMNFKVKYLLGDNWHYKTTKHIWNGDSYTEHQITIKN